MVASREEKESAISELMTEKSISSTGQLLPNKGRRIQKRNFLGRTWLLREREKGREKKKEDSRLMQGADYIHATRCILSGIPLLPSIFSFLNFNHLSFLFCNYFFFLFFIYLINETFIRLIKSISIVSIVV